MDSKWDVIHVRVTVEEKKAFAEVAQAEGTTMSAILRQRIREASIPSFTGDWD